MQAIARAPRFSAAQAVRSDGERWQALMRSAGSRLEVLQMQDSQAGPRDLSLGSKADHFLPYHTLDFWLNLALCHALLVEIVDGEAAYQARINFSLLRKQLLRPRASRDASAAPVEEHSRGTLRARRRTKLR